MKPNFPTLELKNARDIIWTIFVEEFTATPPAIRSLEESVLKWRVVNVVGAPPAVKLNGESVPAEGTLKVSPTRTTTYRLTVTVNSSAMEMARLVLEVDDSACVSQDIQGLDNLLESEISTFINAHATLSFQSGETPEVTSDRFVDVRMKLNKKINNSPNPDLDSKMKLAFFVEDAVLRVRAFQSTVSIDVPWWADVYNFFAGGPDEEVAAKEIATTFENAIQGKIDALVPLLLPDDVILVAARTLADNGGTLEIDYCPKTVEVPPGRSRLVFRETLGIQT